MGMNNDEPFVEMDPTGRYGRYRALLGSGATKKVYLAFDQEEGIEVAWNQVRLGDKSASASDRIHLEVRLLGSLRHPNITALYHTWMVPHPDLPTINFITELCTSGNLFDYRVRHPHVSLRAMKKWSHQILLGIHHLHTRNPCIIHRDIKCNNIFINGNTGDVKIGDLGLSTTGNVAHSASGTLEFVAPELLEKNYTELVDIYSFGMCVLELVTAQTLYLECDSMAEVYKKVTAGVRPAVLAKVRDPEVKAFVERCLGRPRDRPSAAQLLQDPFFYDINGTGKDEISALGVSRLRI